MTTRNQQCVWDATIQLWNVPVGQTYVELPQPQRDRLLQLVDEMKKALKKGCKKWAFQTEQAPTTGRLHFQLRFSAKSKCYLNGAKNLLPPRLAVKAHLSPTSRENSSNSFYVTKEDSRFFGPFLDTDVQMPRQLVPFQHSLLPWQAQLRRLLLHWDPRCIHCIVTEGNIGKTSLMGLMLVWREAAFVPLMSSYKDLMRSVMDQEKMPAYLVDIPRALDVGRELWSALESVKSGYAFDDRYQFKWELFDSPGICVFTNHQPPMGQVLSEDRWAVWSVEDDRLVQTAGNRRDYFEEILN
jgi:hypothetical protein